MNYVSVSRFKTFKIKTALLRVKNDGAYHQ